MAKERGKRSLEKVVQISFLNLLDTSKGKRKNPSKPIKTSPTQTQFRAEEMAEEHNDDLASMGYGSR